MAAQEVDGVHMGGSASRTAGGILGSITGSEGQGRGVSVEVGATEVAIDLTMGVEYGRNIDRKSTRLNSSHANISYAVFCLKKKSVIQVAATPARPFCALPRLSLS